MPRHYPQESWGPFLPLCPLGVLGPQLGLIIISLPTWGAGLCSGGDAQPKHYSLAVAAFPKFPAESSWSFQLLALDAVLLIPHVGSREEEGMGRWEGHPALRLQANHKPWRVQASLLQ